MKKSIVAIVIACLAIIGSASSSQAEPGRAEVVTIDEALTVANNWITLIIQKKGDWGGSETAEVEEIQEFKRGERVLGYFCHVKPHGFIVISLRKELAPVKVYSAVSDLDPKSDEGMADLIKGGMERILNAIEEQIGPLASVRTKDLENILEINYQQAWEELSGDAATFKEGLASGPLQNYQEGRVLLSSAWHQDPPYNDDCPWMGCSNSNGRADVGCVATAGAQIMRYWNWPPYGVGSPYNDTYDWRNMANEYVWGDEQNRWEDENGDPLAQAHLDAVAELCHEVGVAVDMDYGCGGSGADTDDMEDVYEDHYRYSTACVVRDRDDDSAVGWFNRMKTQFNANRPVQYRIPGHSIVGDGWQEIGGTPTRQYHMNYGWGGSHNAWYTLDALHGGDPDEEYMLENIYPAQALGSWVSGTYTRQSFPYRYFDRDATGYSAVFESGQYLQFLPDIVVACTSTTGGSIRFEGSSSYNTRLFTRGDASRGVRIYNGAIKLNNHGSITLH